MPVKGAYWELNSENRKIIDEFVEKLKEEGYTKNSIDTYKRKAARYLLFCQKKKLDVWDGASLQKFAKNAPTDDVTRAKFFLKKMTPAPARENPPASQQSQQDCLSFIKSFMETMKKFEERLAKLESHLGSGKLKISSLVGKPIKIFKLGGGVVKGELVSYDTQFFYVLIESPGSGKTALATSKKKMWQQVKEENHELLKVIPKDVVESIEVSGELFSF
jgi:hypothetical protein